MSIVNIIISVCVPLFTALLSFLGVLYTDRSKRTSIQADLAIYDKCSSIKTDSITNMLPGLESRIAREVYSLVESDCSWLNCLWAALFLAVSAAAFVVSSILMSDALNQGLALNAGFVVGGTAVALVCGVAALVFGITNVAKYRSYRSFTKYINGRITAIASDVEFVHSAVGELAREEPFLRASSERMIRIMNEVQRPFRELGSYPDDKILLFPEKEIWTLEQTEADITESIELVSVALRAIDESFEGREEIRRQVEYLTRKQPKRLANRLEVEKITPLVKELQREKGELRRADFSLRKMHQSVNDAVSYLKDAQSRGVFDDQVVIAGHSGLLLVTDRESERELDLHHFFEQPNDGLIVFRTHDGDDVAVVAQPQDDQSLKVVGILCLLDQSENLDTLLGYSIPTRSVARKKD